MATTPGGMVLPCNPLNLNPTPPSPVPVQLELPVQLRPYQQEGVNWLAFLRRFGLHGVLADDMVRRRPGGGGGRVQQAGQRCLATGEKTDVLREGQRNGGKGGDRALMRAGSIVRPPESIRLTPIVDSC